MESRCGDVVLLGHQETRILSCARTFWWASRIVITGLRFIFTSRPRFPCSLSLWSFIFKFKECDKFFFNLWHERDQCPQSLGKRRVFVSFAKDDLFFFCPITHPYFFPSPPPPPLSSSASLNPRFHLLFNHFFFLAKRGLSDWSKEKKKTRRRRRRKKKTSVIPGRFCCMNNVALEQMLI